MTLEKFKESADACSITNTECIDILLNKIRNMPLNVLKENIQALWSKSANPLEGYLLQNLPDIPDKPLNELYYYNLAENINSLESNFDLNFDSGGDYIKFLACLAELTVSVMPWRKTQWIFK